MLTERDVALEVIREFAGHVDVRTTQIYVEVSDQRKNDGTATLERSAHPLPRDTMAGGGCRCPTNRCATARAI